MVYTRCLEVPYGIIEMEFAGDAKVFRLRPWPRGSAVAGGR